MVKVELTDAAWLYLNEYGPALLGVVLGALVATVQLIRGHRYRAGVESAFQQQGVKIAEAFQDSQTAKVEGRHSQEAFARKLDELEKLVKRVDAHRTVLGGVDVRLAALEKEREERELPAKKLAYLRQLAEELGYGLVGTGSTVSVGPVTLEALKAAQAAAPPRGVCGVG